MFYYFKKYLCIITSICILSVSILPLYAYDVVLGGHSIGILLDYNGVMINDMYDFEYNGKTINQKDYGFKKNDIIVGINQYSVANISDLSSHISRLLKENKEINLVLKRGNNKLNKKLIITDEGDHYITGLYVRDGIEGIGTITYYDQNNNTFGALGHIMHDDSQYICHSGSIYNSSITKIIPSSRFKPGEKIGIRGSDYIGRIDKNLYSGIYGYYDKLPEDYITITVGNKDDLKEGKAYFYTVIEGNKPMKCEIEITHINNTNSNIKNFIFEVTDKEILEKTNGIVQGMSGSPIIQDGKLVGAVTHVLVNDPTRGYGIFIENMLEAAS